MKETGPATGRRVGPPGHPRRDRRRGEVFGQQAALVLIEDGSGRGDGVSWLREHIGPEQGTVRGMSCVGRDASARSLADVTWSPQPAQARGAKQSASDEDGASREEFHQRVG